MQPTAGFFSADLQITSFHASVRPAYIGGLAGKSVASDRFWQPICIFIFKNKVPGRHFKPKLSAAKFQFSSLEILLYVILLLLLLLLHLGNLGSQLNNKL